MRRMRYLKKEGQRVAIVTIMGDISQSLEPLVFYPSSKMQIHMDGARSLVKVKLSTRIRILHAGRVQTLGLVQIT